MPGPNQRPQGRHFARMAVVALVCAAAGAPPSSLPERVPIGPLGDREVTIVNKASRDIVELYVSPSTADAWGSDRLGEKTIGKGSRLTLPLGKLRDCGFDMLAVYDDATREEIHAANLCRLRLVTLDGTNATLPPPPPLPEQHITLINASRLPIQQLYISSPDAAQWGDDLLATAGVSVGEERKLSFHGTCEADVRVIFTNRAAEERHGLNLCRTPTLRIAPGWTTDDQP